MELKRWIYDTRNKSGESGNFLDSLLELKEIKEEDRAEFINPVFHRKKNAGIYQACSEAAELVRSWMKRDKKIVVFGDYDVDGTCATAILIKTFAYLGYDKISYHIPNRFEEGYGINPKSVERLLLQEPEAIISVDCGINANDEVAYLKSKGIEILITDHHTIPENLPKADFVLDPKLCDERESFYDLCGAGVAFYLALHMLPESHDYSELLQLAAMATVADLVPLTRDNRLIVASGIEEMKRNGFAPFLALLKAWGMKVEDLDAGNIAFKIAPSINAAGRLEHAYEALRLLLSEDREEQKRRAEKLVDLNAQRKSRQDRVVEEATEMIDSHPELLSDGVITVFSENWHEGVIGIAASRLVELYHRPAIVFSLKEGILKGSARSVGSFSIYDAISSGAEHLNTFGGHKVACGLSLELGRFDRFQACLREHCKAHLSYDDLQAVQKVDIEVQAQDINIESLSILNHFEPFGIANPRPVFLMKDMNLSSSFYIGKKKEHLKLVLDKEDSSFDAIMFGLKDPQKLNSDYRMDIAFQMKESKYGSKKQIQLMVKNFRSFDPGIKGLPSLAFSYYAKELVSRIEVSRGNIPFGQYDRLQKIDSGELVSLIEAGQRPVVINFESFLSALYALYDSGLSLKKLIDSDYLKGIIQVLPLELDQASFLYGYDSFYVPNNVNRQRKYRSYLSKQLIYSKDYFRKMYLHLKQVKEVDSLKFIYSSLYPLSTAIGLEFFREAGFVAKNGKQFLFLDEKHERYEFEKSRIKVGLDKFHSVL